MDEHTKATMQAQPYLRSGKGTERRQQASQSSRRYIPKGGFLIDFTTQPVPKGKSSGELNGCLPAVPKEVLIARQQQAAARLSAPRYNAHNSPMTKRQQLPDLDLPDHPRPWGAQGSKKTMRETICAHPVPSSHTGHHDKRDASVRTGSSGARTIQAYRGAPVHANHHKQHTHEALDDDEDIFDDDAPLLSAIQVSRAPETAGGPLVHPVRYSSGPHKGAARAPVTSFYVQQLLSTSTDAPESAVQKELLDLKAQITDAAAVLEHEKQAFQLSRAEDRAAWQEVVRMKEKRLHREKTILSRQSQVLLKLPTKREKVEIETLSAALEEERRLGRAKDARHKLTVQRLQRHVAQLQEKVTELEDEIRWHAQNGFSSRQLRQDAAHLYRSRQGTSGSDRVAQATPCNETPQGTSEQKQQNEEARGEPATNTDSAVASHQALSATHSQQPEPQVSSKHKMNDAPDTSSSHHDTSQSAHDTQPTHVSNAAAGVKQARGPGVALSSKAETSHCAKDKMEQRRNKGPQRTPPAVSWQIDVDRSKKPSQGQSEQTQVHSIPDMRHAPHDQPISHDETGSSSNKTHIESPGVKQDTSAPHSTSRVPSSHADVQSVSVQRQRPKPRLLPPLPDFTSMHGSKAASVSQVTPRMEALYASTDLASVFTDRVSNASTDIQRPKADASSPDTARMKIPYAGTDSAPVLKNTAQKVVAEMQTPRAPPSGQETAQVEALYKALDRAPEFTDRSGIAATERLGTDRDTQGLAMFESASVSMDRPHKAVTDRPVLDKELLGAASSSKGAEGKASASSLHGSPQHQSDAELMRAAPTGRSSSPCPEDIQQSKHTSSSSRLPESLSGSNLDSPANDMHSPEPCSSEDADERSRQTLSSCVTRSISAREASDAAAEDSHQSSAAAGDSSIRRDSAVISHESVQPSSHAATHSDEYASIKNSLRDLQALLHAPDNPTENSKLTAVSRTFSSLSTAGAEVSTTHGGSVQADSAASEQAVFPYNGCSKDKPPASRHAPKNATAPAPASLEEHSHASSNTEQQRHLTRHTASNGQKDTIDNMTDKESAHAMREASKHSHSKHAKQDTGQTGRIVTLPNGTVRRQFQDGRACVQFNNGDCKRSFPDGTVEYYYAKADTWHTTCPGGIEIYHFPSGQTEAHHPGDLKEIIFPDGSMRFVQGRGADIVADLDLLSDIVKRGRPAMSPADQ